MALLEGKETKNVETDRTTLQKHELSTANDTEEITKEEVEKAIVRLKKKKAAEEDGVSNEA